MLLQNKTHGKRESLKMWELFYCLSNFDPRISICTSEGLKHEKRAGEIFNIKIGIVAYFK